ncbi:MAG: RHS repeat-associated core domain-containing protein, partial [Planctomycetes bacterium]|nr:RHS repeat-associated core domain-containing protein [Planctomycetota bacterium]
DGWLMLLEVDQYNSVLRKYTWGLDLSRDREGAGGIGGLLSVEDATIQGGPGEYVYFYDANGNVGQLVAWETGYGNATGDEWHADRLVARYEYDPYGNRTNEPAQGEPDQPFQFSTHQFDAETGLLYAKNRYFSSRLGRWLNRDPIGEEGGNNLYMFVNNSPLGLIDPNGRHPITAIMNCFPCLARAQQLAMKDAQRYRDEGTNPGDNGYKAWHCVTACHAYRQCMDKWHPSLRPVLAGVITIGGVAYELATLVGSGRGDSFDGQSCLSWLLDTPGDLVANELGLFIGAFSRKSCYDGCKSAFYIPGPKDPDKANTPWGP